MAGQIHYELYIRKTPTAPWVLQQATEDRAAAVRLADEILEDKRAAAVRVTKETLDPQTMEFQSITILNKGATEPEKRKAQRDPSADPPCASPQDLYTAHAREKIARLMDDWLGRNRITAFELLHRPDMVEKLEASGVEVQHVIQKVAIPESQDTGQPVHEVIRYYQRLGEQAMERVVRAGRKGLFADLSREPIADVARRLVGDPERSFLLGGAICGSLAGCNGWRAKIEKLMAHADAAPTEPQARALVQVVIEQLLCEILGSRAGVSDLMGVELDLGGSLGALVRLAAPKEVAAVARMDADVAVQMPPLEGPAIKLGARLEAGEYKLLAATLARRVLVELRGPRRLRPSDAAGEIDILRALAMSLTAAAGRLLTIDEVQDAFIERSKHLTGADFVGAYLGQGAAALTEAQALVWLCENVAGTANKRAAARWLAACVTALRFEKELRAAPESPPQRLRTLAALQKSVRGAGFSEKDRDEIIEAIGNVGGLIEADAKLVANLARAPAPASKKLALLLQFAAGEAAPLGPAADRAKAEVIKLFRAPETRAEIGKTPEVLGELKGLMQAAGLAA